RNLRRHPAALLAFAAQLVTRLDLRSRLALDLVDLLWREIRVQRPVAHELIGADAEMLDGILDRRIVPQRIVASLALCLHGTLDGAGQYFGLPEQFLRLAFALFAAVLLDAGD